MGGNGLEVIAGLPVKSGGRAEGVKKKLLNMQVGANIRGIEGRFTQAGREG